ncbi:EcWRKY-41, partial [Eragrostis curvula]
MESVDGNGGSRLVVTELRQIKDLVMELETHLDGSHDLCRHLVSQIFSLTERSIGIITSSNFDNGRKRSWSGGGIASATPSPLGDVANVPFRSNKKGTTMRKRQVRVNSVEGGEAPVEDGHSWRKYGQKPILGAKYPRSYYRCRHRHSQGCTAMKKVQRADEDPAFFDVIYYGTHTCVETTAAGHAAPPAPERNPDAHGLLQSLGGSLTVKTEEPQGWNATAPFFPSSTPVSWCPTPATSFQPFEAPGLRAKSELQDVVSALVAATSAPSVPAVDVAGEFVDIDTIARLFA